MKRRRAAGGRERSPTAQERARDLAPERGRPTKKDRREIEKLKRRER